HSIAGAFLATLYGVGSANLIFLPIANRLKDMSSEELAYREMLLEAILSIQAGDNPRMLAEKLETFVPPAMRGEEAEEAKEKGGQAILQPEGARVSNVERQSEQKQVLNQKFANTSGADSATRDLESLQQLAQRIDRYAATHGLNGQVRTSIDERGLIVRLLTD